MKKHNSFALILSIFLLLGSLSNIQAQLGPGDLAVVYLRTDAFVNDTITILTLVPLNAGDVFYLTDESVHNNNDSTGADVFDNSGADGAIFTASTSYPAFSLLTYVGNGAGSAEWTDYGFTFGTNYLRSNGSSTPGLNPSQSGAQLFIFIDSDPGNAIEPAAEPVFIYGMQTHESGWAAALAAGPPSTASVKPHDIDTAGASLHFYDVANGEEFDNSIYNGPLSFTSKSHALSEITNPNNWIGTDINGNPGTGVGTVGDQAALYSQSSLFHNTGSNPFTLNTDGLEERFDIPLSYKVYPNPTHDFLNLVFQSEQTIVLRAIIYDLTGRSTGIQSEAMQLRPEGRARLDLNPLAKGVYMLNLVDEDGAVRGSLLVNKR